MHTYLIKIRGASITKHWADAPPNNGQLGTVLAGPYFDLWRWSTSKHYVGHLESLTFWKHTYMYVHTQMLELYIKCCLNHQYNDNLRSLLLTRKYNKKVILCRVPIVLYNYRILNDYKRRNKWKIKVKRLKCFGVLLDPKVLASFLFKQWKNSVASFITLWLNHCHKIIGLCLRRLSVLPWVYVKKQVRITQF